MDDVNMVAVVFSKAYLAKCIANQFSLIRCGLRAKPDKFLKTKIFFKTKFFSSFVLKLRCPGPAAIFTEKTLRRPVETAEGFSISANV